jgi:hypothetical protein
MAQNGEGTFSYYYDPQVTIDIICTDNSVNVVTEDSPLANPAIQYVDVNPTNADPLYLINNFSPDNS